MTILRRFKKNHLACLFSIEHMYHSSWLRDRIMEVPCAVKTVVDEAVKLAVKCDVLHDTVKRETERQVEVSEQHIMSYLDGRRFNTDLKILHPGNAVAARPLHKMPIVMKSVLRSLKGANIMQLDMAVDDVIRSGVGRCNIESNDIVKPVDVYGKIGTKNLVTHGVAVYNHKDVSLNVHSVVDNRIVKVIKKIYVREVACQDSVEIIGSFCTEKCNKLNVTESGTQADMEWYESVVRVRDCESVTDESVVDDADIVELIAQLKLMSEDEFVKAKSTINGCDSSDGITNGERKMNEILDLIGVRPCDTLDLCANPGGFSLALAKRGFQVVTHYWNTSASGIPMLGSIGTYSNIRTIEMGTAYSGDLMNDADLEHVVLSAGVVDLVVGDGCDIAGFNRDDVGLVNRQLVIAYRVLKPGGIFVVKVPYSRAINLIVKKVKWCFENVQLFKPASSNKLSCECYLVCKGFGRSNDKFSLSSFDNVKLSIISSITKALSFSAGEDKFDAVSNVGSVVSTATSKSVLSRLSRAFSKKRVVVDDIEVDTLLSRLTRHGLVAGGALSTVTEHDQFAIGKGLHVGFYSDVDGKTVEFGRGVKKCLKLSSTCIARSKLSRYAHVLGLENECLLLCNDDERIVIMVKYIDNLLDVIIEVLRKCLIDERMTCFSVCLDLTWEVNLIRFTSFLQDCRGKLDLTVCGYRSPYYDFLAVTPVVEARVTSVFPTLGTADLEFVREPTYLPGSSVIANFRNAFIEYRHTVALADRVNAVELQRIWKSIHDSGVSLGQSVIQLCSKYCMNVYDNLNKRYILEETREFMYGYADGYVEWIASSERYDTEHRHVLVSKGTKVMLNVKIASRLWNIDLTSVVLPFFEWYNGTPGCGKTTFIVDSHAVGRDMILTATVEGVEDVRRRVKVKHPEVSDDMLRTNYRTTMSVLVNGVRDSFEKVYIDEALMMHAGAIVALCAIIKCKTVVLLGDRNQIPFIDRDHVCVMKYAAVDKFASIHKELSCTYRCPIDVAMSLKPLYDCIYSASKVVHSMRMEALSGSVIPNNANTLYLVHFQSDKESMLRDKYGNRPGSKVLTINEAQGLCFPNVICVRFSAKPLQLYASMEQAVVAISRHTESFVYYTSASDDVIVKLILRTHGLTDGELINANAMNRLKGVKLGYVERDFVMTDFTINRHDNDCGRGLGVVCHLPMRPRVVRETVVPNGVSVYARTLPDFDLLFLQQFYDDKMPGVSQSSCAYEQEMLEYQQVDVTLDKISVTTCKGTLRPRRFDKLTPTLRTSMSAYRFPSMIETVCGLMKRNLNAPCLLNDMSPKQLGKYLFVNFERSCIDDELLSMYDSFQDDIVDINEDIIGEWLDKQPPNTARMCTTDVPLHERSFNRYSFMVKPNVKPSMDKGCMSKYASVQTISFTDKDVNVIFLSDFECVA